MLPHYVDLTLLDITNQILGYLLSTRIQTVSIENLFLSGRIPFNKFPFII